MTQAMSTKSHPIPEEDGVDRNERNSEINFYSVRYKEICTTGDRERQSIINDDSDKSPIEEIFRDNRPENQNVIRRAHSTAADSSYNRKLPSPEKSSFRHVPSYGSVNTLNSCVQERFEAFRQQRIHSTQSDRSLPKLADTKNDPSNRYTKNPLEGRYLEIARSNTSATCEKGQQLPLSLRRKFNLNTGAQTLAHVRTVPSPTFNNHFDIETGSLIFKKKAIIRSDGVKFDSGKKFDIRITDFDFLDEIGHGNYGVVRKVSHKSSGIEMALKEVRLNLDDSTIRQILMELEVLHNAIHANIVDFYGAFCTEGSVYFCIEYMNGGSISELNSEGCGEPVLAYIAKSAVAGLKFLKDKLNVIHRDVKPTNILADTNGDIKLCDFGVSGNLTASIARTNIGCQSYYAPERIKSQSNSGENEYGIRADVWSLGLSIVEMSLGEYPYSAETYSSIFAQLSAICDGESPELDTARFSTDACKFVKQCLQKDSRKRPTYNELVRHHWLEQCPCTKEEMAEWVKSKLSQSKRSISASRRKQPPLHRVALSDIKT